MIILFWSHLRLSKLFFDHLKYRGFLNKQVTATYFSCFANLAYSQANEEVKVSHIDAVDSLLRMLSQFSNLAKVMKSKSILESFDLFLNRQIKEIFDKDFIFLLLVDVSHICNEFELSKFPEALLKLIELQTVKLSKYFSQLIYSKANVWFVSMLNDIDFKLGSNFWLIPFYFDLPLTKGIWHPSLEF